ncbi:hypothetical protein GUJ93_ZPchr0012g20794 [Zizania palustris]|uniref:Ubiquitin-like protease family profile domain-containing protein n=1 Tax=Zizania palustris TaxID=103762 RepID=A0A8J5WJQ0_ZIZPA|nr:hypothetical protein GUJ93_ZPchr0012g20794 [Zizania palustris]
MQSCRGSRDLLPQPLAKPKPPNLSGDRSPAAMRAPIKIDWEEVLPEAVSSRGGDGDEEACFVSFRSPPRASRTREEAEIVGMKDGEMRPEIVSTLRPRRRFEGALSDGGDGNRHRRALLAAEARRPGIDTAAKDGDGCRSAAHDVFKFNDEDRLGEYASRKFYWEPLPVCSTKKNYGQLGIKAHKSLRQVGQRKPISVDKMYSSKPCPSTSSGHNLRVQAIDPDEKSDDEKCQLSASNYLRNSNKRRKENHDSCFPGFQKVRDVVLLDDEDVQPEGQLDCVVREKWNESKIYYPSRDDPEAVELSGSDIKCLDPRVYLSSPVINYYIQYIKRTKLCDDDCRDKFYIFNTYFYSKLEEALLGKGEFVKLRRWWKGINIYHRAYIILPIHGT